jgi:hypothetical protein
MIAILKKLRPSISVCEPETYPMDKQIPHIHQYFSHGKHDRVFKFGILRFVINDINYNPFTGMLAFEVDAWHSGSTQLRVRQLNGNNIVYSSNIKLEIMLLLETYFDYRKNITISTKWIGFNS